MVPIQRMVGIDIVHKDYRKLMKIPQNSNVFLKERRYCYNCVFKVWAFFFWLNCVACKILVL